MDLASNFSLLHAKLSKLGFCHWERVSEGDVMTGNPHTYALFLRFLYHRFPASTAVLIRKHEWFLVEHSDTHIGATTVRLLAAEAGERHGISGAQFSQCKYASAKVTICHSLLRLLHSLTRRSSTQTSAASARITGRVPRLVCALPTASSKPSAAASMVNQRRRELNSLLRS
ncbi:hypothetical protein JKF63_04498 [Porcisia hertigi]|uniref:Uncharacterized protein n=1 Tax=Porcisia hertigi TaxID=2761500 RepID=A0A836L8B3_9TRYP|nr:hypothetical protein JKF63_04498 [Porcisia hertigi]